MADKKPEELQEEVITPDNTQSPVTRDQEGRLSTGFTPLE
jgi:hypothetical protein